MSRALVFVLLFVPVFTASFSEREDRKIESAKGNNGQSIDASGLPADSIQLPIADEPVSNWSKVEVAIDKNNATDFEGSGFSHRMLDLNSSQFPHEFARKSNFSVSFRQGRNGDIKEEQEEEGLESLDALFPEALVSRKSHKDSDQDYLTFSSVGDVYSENGTSYDEDYEELESLDALEPSALISTTYNVEEVIENLDDLTAGALIANYLFEDDLENPSKPNATTLFEKKLYDLDQLLDGTGVNATVLLSAVETLRKAGGLQSLLKATKGAGIPLFPGMPTGANPALSSLGPLSAGISSLGKVGGAMKHQDMDEIRRELKQMLFGDEVQKDSAKSENRRMGNFRPSQQLPPAEDRFWKSKKKPEYPPASPRPNYSNSYKPASYEASHKPKPNYPPPPPIPHNKNLDFGGYVRIHLPTIMGQIKGQQKPQHPKHGYQRPGYFRHKASDRNFRPSEEIDGKKETSFKPIPPPPRTPAPVIQNERNKNPIMRPPQRPVENQPRSPPFERYESGPIRTKEVFGSSSQQRITVDTHRCDTFWENICMEVDVYPAEQMRSHLLKNKAVADTLLADVKRQSADNLVDGIPSSEERKYTYGHYYGTRRQGDEAHLHRDFANNGGYICPSDIVYGRPKRAKNSKGEWKYIVNFGDYTQTLRFEKCLKPGGSCSYLAQYFISQCSQVYNYHRLLAWDERTGLHMDIFKVPTGCSCHIGGHNTPSDPTTLAPPKKRKIQKYREEEVSESKSIQTQEEDEGTGQFIDMDSFVSQNFGERFPERFPERRSESFDNEHPKPRPPKFTQPTSPSRVGTSVPSVKQETVGRSAADDDKSRVNYGYHPIIDFFQNYRFTAAR